MPSDLVLLLLLSSCSLLLCDDTKHIRGTAGENVTLECLLQVSQNDVIAVLEWKKPDLKSGSYVFFFRDQRVNVHFQDERFRGRVELRDPEMKNGTVSIVLKNVTTNDSGTYECKVSVERSGQRHKPTSHVRLTVTEPGHTDGATGGGDQGGGDQGGGDQGKGDQGGGDQGGGDQGGGDQGKGYQGGGYQGRGDKRGHSALIAVAVIAVIAVIGGLILASIRRRKNSHQPAGDDDAEQEALSSKERRTE